jgi:hypothetical protein
MKRKRERESKRLKKKVGQLLNENERRLKIALAFFRLCT